MNDLLITKLPTLVNIEKLSLTELREQYKRLEGDAIDQAAILLMVKTLSEKRTAFKAKQKEQVH